MKAAEAVDLDRIPELDGLRGMAILLVLVWHYGVCQIMAGGNLRLVRVVSWLTLTWSGVDLFFVLSGFLIGGILLDHRGSPGFFRSFYIRRACRIFPLYFLLVALGVVGSALAAVYAVPGLEWLFFDPRPLPLWSFLSFTQNLVMASWGSFGPNFLGITWSLAIEEQFYLVLPFLVYFVAPKRLPWVLLAITGFALVLRAAILSWYPGHPAFPGLPAFFLMPSRADALMLGVLGAYGVRNVSLRRFFCNETLLKWALAALVTGAAFVPRGYLALTSPGMTLFGHLWLALTFLCLLLLTIAGRGGWAASITRIPQLRSLGQLAYGVYLFHQPVAGTLHALILNRSPTLSNGAQLGVTLLSLAVTLVIAKVSWTFFEKRFIDWGHRHRYVTPHAAMHAPLTAEGANRS